MPEAVLSSRKKFETKWDPGGLRGEALREGS